MNKVMKDERLLIKERGKKAELKTEVNELSVQNEQILRNALLSFKTYF